MIRGIVGVLKWHHYTAADIRGYAVSQTGSALTLTGTISTRDAFKLAQRPLVFQAPWKTKTQQGVWSWPILEFWLSPDSQITARLGPMDSRAFHAIPPPQDLYV